VSAESPVEPQPLPPLTDPDEPFVDGFNRRTVLGAFFVALVMMPGTIYLGLVAGKTLGPAAEWVTIILFAEIARRSFYTLKRQEVFVLFYVAAALSASTLVLGDYQLAGGPFTGLIWNQYLAQSPQTDAIADQIPAWVTPRATSPAIQHRTLLHTDWLWPIVLVMVGQVLSRMNWFGMGYILFRITSDMERLPFPLAPIAAEGATALAEATTKEQSWRWQVFSTGAALGLVFGTIYVVLPVVTGLVMTQPLMLLPIPFVDFTTNTETLLPGGLFSISFDLLLVLTGMILPFPMVVGTFIACILTSFVFNPVLYHLGMFPHYTLGTRLIPTQMTLAFDFYMSTNIGVGLAVALLGLGRILVVLRRAVARRRSTMPDPHDQLGYDRRPSRARGDVPMWAAALLFVAGTSGYIYLCHLLVPGFKLWIVIAFGLLWTPINSYVSARMIGMTGSPLVVPFLREGSFLLSGYPKVDIWFAPIPLADYGPIAQRFRELELTRTKFTSIIKAELLIAPLGLIASFLFWAFFWHLGQIPSADYPYTARIWPVHARAQFLFYTATVEDNPMLLEALKPWLIGCGAVGGMLFYGVCALVGLPITFFYGFIGGTGAFLYGGLSMFIGAMFGRYYFAKRFGPERWRRYVPVVAAGFACGMGLAGMISVACALIARSASVLPF